MVDYYDALLITIPLALGAGTLLSVHPAVDFHQGLVAGCVVSTLVLFEAIFRNPPVEPTFTDAVASVVVLLGWAGVGVLLLGG